MKKQFLILFAFISVLALSQVPQRFNKVIVTGDITSPKFIKTGSNADSVLLGNGSARAISAIKTDTVSLSNRINAKATGNGTANGTNTGDETLTSIKTKLGAATSVSDGYLKYQDFALLHAPTTVTASNGLSISGQNISLQNASLTQSGALTFNDWTTFNSKEPAITKNTGFNKNFGTTPGTVLEGRTFGTASNSAVGDFIQNQNASAQSANMWINGSIRTNGADRFIGNSVGALRWIERTNSNQESTGNLGSNYELIARADDGSSLGSYFSILRATGAATFASSVSATQLQSTVATGTSPLTVNSTTMVGNLNADLLDGQHASAFQPAITGLTNNYIPKWNGSSFVNSNANYSGDDFTFGAGKLFGLGDKANYYIDMSTGYLNINWYYGINLNSAGATTIQSSTPSTSPTNGALVVSGGIGANHVRANNFYGNGSNLTGVQLPITLTTNGTSGAATFENGVMNVPNYSQSVPYSYGAYSPTVTAIAGISSIGTNTSYFTNIGSIYHVSSLVGLITSVNVNETCTVQITLPSTPTTSTSISVMGVAGDAVQAYYNGSTSGNTIRITFKSPVASGAGTTVKITADYY